MAGPADLRRADGSPRHSAGPRPTASPTSSTTAPTRRQRGRSRSPPSTSPPLVTSTGTPSSPTRWVRAVSDRHRRKARAPDDAGRMSPARTATNSPPRSPDSASGSPAESGTPRDRAAAVASGPRPHGVVRPDGQKAGVNGTRSEWAMCQSCVVAWRRGAASSASETRIFLASTVVPGSKPGMAGPLVTTYSETWQGDPKNAPGSDQPWGWMPTDEIARLREFFWNQNPVLAPDEWRAQQGTPPACRFRRRAGPSPKPVSVPVVTWGGDAS